MMRKTLANSKLRCRDYNQGYQVDNRSVLEKMHFRSWYTSPTHMSEEFGQDPTNLELQE